MSWRPSEFKGILFREILVSGVRKDLSILNPNINAPSGTSKFNKSSSIRIRNNK